MTKNDIFILSFLEMSDSDTAYDSPGRILFQSIMTAQNEQWKVLLSTTNLIFDLNEETLVTTCTKIVKEIKNKLSSEHPYGEWLCNQ